MSMSSISSSSFINKTFEAPTPSRVLNKSNESEQSTRVQSNPSAFGKTKDLTSQLSDNNEVLKKSLGKPISKENANLMSSIMTGDGVSKEVSTSKGKSFKASTEASFEKGHLSGEASAKINGRAEARASASIGIGPDGVKANAYAGTVGKVESNAKCSSSVCGIEVASATAKGSAKGGVETKAKGHIDSNGIGGSVGGFAGVKVKGSVGGALGPVEAKAKGELIAGFAAKAKGEASFEDGKLELGLSLKLAAGIGLGGSIKIGLDFNKLNPINWF